LSKSEILNKSILSNGETKSILKLNDGTEVEITLIVNRGISVFINDNVVIFEEVAPIIKNKTALVPLRKLAESLDVEIGWDQSTKTITGKGDNKTFTLTVGSKLATLNGEHVELDETPIIVQGSAMAPARFIAESLEMEIQWDNDTRSVKLYKNRDLMQEIMKLFKSYINKLKIIKLILIQ